MDQTPPTSGFSQPPLYAQIVPEPTPTPPKRKPGALARFFLTLLFLGFLGSVGLNFLLFTAVGLLGISSAEDEGRVKEKYFAMNRHGGQKVAVISIEGTILSGEGFFKHQIDHAKKDIADGNLKAIVLRVNSPGGTIAGSDYMLHHLRKLVNDPKVGKIPIVVSMGSVAASGGYYVSMCVGDAPDTIFAERSTWTGSIGVMIPHYNLASLMEKCGIQDDAITSHHLKDMGSITRQMTPEERKIFQQLVEEGFTQFKNVIKDGRPKFRQDPAALDKLATGQVYTSEQALKLGLIDRVGFIEDAIDKAVQLARLDPADVKVVKYKEEPHLAELLFGKSQARPAFDVAAILETTTPRAYYLCTWLPALANNSK
jgi:protease IV